MMSAVDKFEELDENFKELSALLNFRDKEKDRRDHFQAKREGTLSEADQEMEDWNKEMKSYMFERKVKATDRTKTPDEIAKEEAERLHELETRRLARMNGDFDEDDLSDISDDEDDKKSKKKKFGNISSKGKAAKRARNPDELDSDDEESDELEARFTADGLVYVDREGNVVKKAGEDESDIEEQDLNNGLGRKAPKDDDDDDETPEDSSDDEDSDDLGDSDDDASVESGDGLSSGEESDIEGTVLDIGTKVKGKYLADQQFEGKSKWYAGAIQSITNDEKGNILYDILYDDGDVEQGVKPENVRRRKKSADEKKAEDEKQQKIVEISSKRQKAKQKARYVKMISHLSVALTQNIQYRIF